MPMLFLKESLNLRLEIKNSTGALFYETNTDIDLILPLFSDEHLCDSEGFFHKKHEALSVFHESNKKEKKQSNRTEWKHLGRVFCHSFPTTAQASHYVEEEVSSASLKRGKKKTRQSKLLWGRKIVTVRKSQCDLVFCHLPSGSLYTKHVAIERDGERERRTESL